MNPIVSIILPTYNVEKYLLRCLESINKQTFVDYEVIVIVDGATDRSYDIAKDYCKDHDKFKVFWQDNAGSGPARNNGLSKSNGQFVMFVDPDDWLEPELLDILYKSQFKNDYDLVITKRIFVTCDNDGNIIRLKKDCYEEESIIGINEVRNNYLRLLKSKMIDSPTQKLYKMSIIRENSIVFPDLRRSQDIVFNYRYYNYVSSIFVSSYSGYNYIRTLQDFAGKMDANYYKTIIFLYNDIKALYANWDLKVDAKKLATFFFDIRLMSFLQRCADQKWPIDSILENDVVYEIINLATPKALQNKLIRRCLLKKNYKLSTYLLKSLLTIKRRIKSL